MVAATERGLNKSGFIREVLTKNPTATAPLVNQAWAEAGREGSISETLVNKLRSEMGLSGNLRGRPRAASAAQAGEKANGRKRRRRVSAKANGRSRTPADGSPAAPAAERKPRSGERGRMLEEVEGDIDRLIFKLMIVGGMADVEDALRRVRRVVVRSHKA
jgi:hypothetical protein